MRIFTFFAISLFMALAAVNAYAGQKWTVDVPAAPAYSQSGPIPIAVGIDVDETPSVQSCGPSHESRPYGPMIVDELKKMKVFNKIIYPYGKGGAADAVLHLTVRGQWSYYSKELEPRDYWAGLSTVHDVEGTHDIKAVLTAKGKEILDGSASVTSKGRYSGQDYEAITGRLNDIQARKIAVAVADMLRDKRAQIVAKVFNRPEEVRSSNPAAGRSEVSSGTGRPAGGEYKTAEKLRELEDLHASGALSDEEFGKAEKRLLDMQKLEDLYKSGILTEQEVRKAKARMLEK
ncbi:MAG: SHOCT domain-containing protein [Nitrospiraceae bacterium]|nr:SHOCT domain-containing protein [Nitrospiraceae bacterium]